MNSSQQQYLQAIGIECWERRDKPASFKLMIVSEKTLTSDAKKLLINMFNTIGLTENDLLITVNSDDLTQQISKINPGLFILFDDNACEILLKTTSSLQDLRHKIHYFGEKKSPAIVTFHPEYLLKNPVEKKNAYADLLFIQKNL